MERDLRAALDAFVASHRGLRVGRLFGSPAAFAGRRVFARLDNDCLRLRLPPSGRAALKGGPYEYVVGRASKNVRSGRAFRPAVPSRAVASDWIAITPHSEAAQRLEILLEQAARYVALS